ncbi:MAG: iron ABC transporter permease [Lachnospiraceae bacterium]|nr:iron ABC transporter permease [Lachnospiraceae bacterium]
MVRNRTSYKLQFLILIAAFVVAVLVSVVLGRYSLSLGDFFRVIWSKLPFTNVPQTWAPSAENVLFQIRLPRIACAVLIGAALSLAGICYQGMFRNPMVSPDILGASTGAGFGAALAILLGAGYFVISATSFVFGLGAVLLAYVVSRFSKTNETVAMILAGMIISALFSAGTSYIKLVADTQDQLPAITYWLMGSLSSIKARDLLFILIPIAVGMIPLFILRWRLNLLTVEEETSKSLGINITLLRAIVIICATLLTSASVSVSGMIGWVGLVIPHFCRILFGYDYRRLIPATALFGATFLLVVDDIARLATTGEIPLGILTSFVGCPLFLYLLLTGGGRRERRA